MMGDEYMSFDMEQKNVIHTFYKNQLQAFDTSYINFNDNTELGYFLWKLESELSHKDCCNGISNHESDLLVLLIEDSQNQKDKGINSNFNYSNELINSFRESLNECMGLNKGDNGRDFY
jgi:hypothetical protein